MPENVPIYQQITAYIKETIEKGIYQKGNIIPSEQELCNQFDTSRMTVRRAINDLVNDGTLYRIQGRGTFVSHFVFRKYLEVLGFSYHMRTLGFQPSSKILSFEIQKPEKNIAEELKILPSDNVFYLSRVRMADLEPIAIENVFLPEKRFPGLDKYSLEENSLYDTLRTYYKTEIFLRHEKINAIVAEGTDANILFSKNKGVVMHTWGVDFDTNMNPIAYADSLYHGTKYTFDIVIK
ncbi:GntR family transcriptional regulator [Pelolinea submarina]|uniref:GntR family transcriptional regulator n=2 Tax=Pelolinea submarina TaxID=913107 RepID=A0A347ZUU9_9CHLR|nr:GntR family transcriptional regulator [Pelolinea submarina]BBB49080.1 GntR family transcriptional regulator [Pelolinea submarina]